VNFSCYNIYTALAMMKVLRSNSEEGLPLLFLHKFESEESCFNPYVLQGKICWQWQPFIGCTASHIGQSHMGCWGW